MYGAYMYGRARARARVNVRAVSSVAYTRYLLLDLTITFYFTTFKTTTK